MGGGNRTGNAHVRIDDHMGVMSVVMTVAEAARMGGMGAVRTRTSSDVSDRKGGADMQDVIQPTALAICLAWASISPPSSAGYMKQKPAKERTSGGQRLLRGCRGIPINQMYRLPNIL